MATWWAEHWTEVVGFVTGAACVLLAAQRSIWNFPVGILNTLTFLVLFASSALYADAGLQLVYLALAAHGWVAWARGGGDAAAGGFALRTPRAAVLPLVVAAIAGTALLTVVLTAFTDSSTQLADAATTAVSLVAQFILNRRWLENWFVWIAVDVAYVGLYAVKGLWITAALYLVFIGLCVDGLRSWRADRRRSTAPAAHPGPVPADA